MKIPTPKLPINLVPNAYVTKGGSLEVLELCLHLKENPKFTKADDLNSLNTKFYARVVKTPPWLANVKPTENLAILIKNFHGLGDFKGFVVLEQIVQSQWMEATQTYGAVLEGSLYYEVPTERVDATNPFT